MFRTQYNPSYDASQFATPVGGASRTKQSFKDECDINRIVSRAQKAGFMPSGNGPAAQFGDFSTVTDYQTALNVVMRAQQAFDSLPAELRKRFDNDPNALVEFVADNGNYDEAVELGLVPPKPSKARAAPSPSVSEDSPTPSTE